MTETKRGRKSQANYQELVAKALLSSRFELEEFPVLSQLPAIEQWAAAHEWELLPHGKALNTLLHQAVEEVITKIGETDDAKLLRVVEYLRLRYLQQAMVKGIAEKWGCSVVQVWRAAGHRAIELVTEQFLELARTSE